MAMVDALNAIDPLTAGGVPRPSAVFTRYMMITSAVAARRRFPAVTWSSIWYRLSSFAVIKSTQNRAMPGSPHPGRGWVPMRQWHSYGDILTGATVAEPIVRPYFSAKRRTGP